MITIINIKKSLIASILTGITISQFATPITAIASTNSSAKNVIVMISDGWGYNQIAATDYYQYGYLGSQVYEEFPFKSGMSTYSITANSYNTSKAWSDLNYVKENPTDSAAAATAMSTGVKTYDAAIGVDANKKELTHISEYFKNKKKSTGVVSTVEFSHATPAGFVAHNTNRNNYSEIANEMLKDSKTDVIMGTGNPLFDDNGNPSKQTYKYVGGEETWNGLVNGTLEVSDIDGDGVSDPWTLIQSKEDFKNLATGETPKRVLGIPEVHTTLQQARSGDNKADAYSVPLNNNVPTLSDMSKAALNVLDNNDNGFFLMIEGGAIDWAGHANQSGRLIEEQADFNKAVESVVDWVEKNSSWDETLLIVTGDHETGYLTGPNTNPDWTSIICNGKGNMPTMQWNTGNHTNSIIPFFAKGAGSRLFRERANKIDIMRGDYIDNTDIANVIKELIS